MRRRVANEIKPNFFHHIKGIAVEGLHLTEHQGCGIQSAVGNQTHPRAHRGTRLFCIVLHSESSTPDHRVAWGGQQHLVCVRVVGQRAFGVCDPARKIDLWSTAKRYIGPDEKLPPESARFTSTETELSFETFTPSFWPYGRREWWCPNGTAKMEGCIDHTVLDMKKDRMWMECGHYRGISLVVHAGKVFLK